MKYIDAEKLLAEIEDRLHCNGAFDEVDDYAWHYDQGMVAAYNHIKEFITSLQQEKPNNMIQWTGNNLKEVIDFTGKSPRLGEWFKSWEEYENYVHTHNNILKLFCDDGSHYEVPVGAWIVKTPDGYNVPSVAKYIQQEQPVHSHYTKVRETKTGRVFLAEYSSEAAEWYEAGTGKAYSISDVEIVKEQPEVDLEKLVNEEFASHSRTTEYGLEVTYNRAELYQLIKRMALVFNARNEGSGVELIATERKRQIEVEGWTKEHDATYTNNELAKAAICYADPNVHYYQENRFLRRRIPNTNFWPIQWDKCWFKPSNDRIRDLVKAGALIAAEIDRLNARKED